MSGRKSLCRSDKRHKKDKDDDFVRPQAVSMLKFLKKRKNP